MGALGLIDHASLQPGVLVPMHQHRNDEILSYLRRGTMVHEDSTGQRVPLTATHLMMMNAGSGFSHEESVPAGEPVELLQIFLRPEAAELPPQVQFHTFAAANSPNAWRLVGGPAEAAAPLTVRNRVWLYDAELTQATLDLPALDGRTALLYVFSGRATLPATQAELQTGDFALVADEPLRVHATEATRLALFLVDMQAVFSRAGTLSG